MMSFIKMYRAADLEIDSGLLYPNLVLNVFNCIDEPSTFLKHMF